MEVKENLAFTLSSATHASPIRCHTHEHQMRHKSWSVFIDSWNLSLIRRAVATKQTVRCSHSAHSTHSTTHREAPRHTKRHLDTPRRTATRAHDTYTPPRPLPLPRRHQVTFYQVSAATQNRNKHTKHHNKQPRNRWKQRHNSTQPNTTFYYATLHNARRHGTARPP